MNKVVPIFLLAILLVILGVAGFLLFQDSPDNQASAAATEVVTAQVVATEEVAVTEVVTEEARPTSALAAQDPGMSNDGIFSVSVLYSLMDESSIPSNLPELPADEEWLLMNVSVGNAADTGATITVQPDSMVLVDEDGNEFLPLSAEETIQYASPALIGAELEPGSSVTGFLFFAVPADNTPQSLRWCVDDACAEPLLSDINLRG